MTTQPTEHQLGSDKCVLTMRIEQSFRRLPIALVVNLVNGLLLGLVLWDAVGKSQLLFWLALLFLVTAARFASMRAFWRALSESQFDYDTWARHFTIGACAAGLVWGSTSVLLFDPESLPHQMFLVFIIGGMVAGAVPLLASVPAAFPCFALSAVVPLSLQMFSTGDRVHFIMGLLIVVFGLAMLATAAQVRSLFRDAENLKSELKSSLEAGNQLERIVRLDPLTQVPNRLFFDEALDREWRSALRESTSLAVIMADLDYFKKFNDRYGHFEGDQCLILVARTMQNALSRPGDVVSRIGGEEFAFLLPRTELHGALNVAGQIQQKIEEMAIPHESSPTSDIVTVSFGVASSGLNDVSSSADLIRAADAALYLGKQGGRNRIAAAPNVARKTVEV